jgi:hypothetical protein
LVAVYLIWFIFCQDVIQYILEHAIDVSALGGGARSPITGWIGIFVLPFLIVLAIMAITAVVLDLWNKVKRKKHQN